MFGVGLHFLVLFTNVYQSALVPQTPPLSQGIIQPYSSIFRILCNACIYRNLTNVEYWNIQNPSIIASQHVFRTLSYLLKLTNIQNKSDMAKRLRILRSLRCLKSDTYSEPCQRFKIDFFQTQLKPIITFQKRSILDLWLGSEYDYHSVSTH